MEGSVGRLIKEGLLFSHLFEGSKISHETFQDSRPLGLYERRTSWIQIRSSNYLTALFSNTFAKCFLCEDFVCKTFFCNHSLLAYQNCVIISFPLSPYVLYQIIYITRHYHLSCGKIMKCCLRVLRRVFTANFFIRKVNQFLLKYIIATTNQTAYPCEDLWK